jgi:hypothetical protein
MSEMIMCSKLEIMAWKEEVMAYFKAFFQYLPGKTENCEKSQDSWSCS